MESRDPALSGRTRRIPRPWLHRNRHHNPHMPAYPPPNAQPYLYAPPLVGGPLVTPPGAAIDLLEKQEWKVSWDKLACCFCVRSPPTSRKHDHRDGRLHGYGLNGGRRMYHHDQVPFPAFPIIRRNSSSSFLSNENDLYESGSVSSFTESDTSYSDNETPRNRKERQDEKAVVPAKTAAKQGIAKPPTVSNRSKSAGLPPVNPSSASLATPQRAETRNRLDTSDNTGIYSGTSTSSRHLRKPQFHFSARSMEQILKDNNHTDSATPPTFVLCHENEKALIKNDGGYMSGLDDSEDTRSRNDASLYDGDRDDNDHDTESPLSKRGRQATVEEWKRRKAERPPKAGMVPTGRTKSKKVSSKPKKTIKKPPKKVENTLVPTYLRKNSVLDNGTAGSLVLSGWVAVGFGGDSLASRFRDGSRSIESKDIFYLRIVDKRGLGEGTSMLLHAASGAVEHIFPLKTEWMCSSREISCRIGRYVSVSSRNTPAREILTILPVSLDDAFFPKKAFVTAQQFNRLHERLFISGKGKVYAPDEQHDAATHIMFSLDTMITNSRK